MLKIKDDTKSHTSSYFWLVLTRQSDEAKEIGIIDWIKLTLFELMFGEELLEQLTLTSSYNNVGENQKTGHMLHLNDIIPAGFLTNLFRQQILQLLYFKFFKIYLFLASESEVRESDSVVDLTRSRFAMRHELLYQVIAFRRVYILCWLCFNISIDLIVYSTSDLQTAILSALTIEGLRRLLKL